MMNEVNVGTLLDELAGRVDGLADTITGRIRAEVPGYAQLPYAEHRRDVREQIKNVVEGVGARQPPPAAAIEHARAVGRRRAARHVALPDVIEAYHIAYREIWDELLTRAKDFHPDLTSALVGEVALLWSWFHRLSAAVADAHAEETRVREATQLALRRRFVETLSGTVSNPEEQDSLARSLGFAPDGEFVVAVAAGVPETRVEQINTSLGETAGVAHCAYDSGRTVLVAQRCTHEELLGAVHHGEPSALTGTGLIRRGLEGAALSLTDATEALGWALTEGRDVCFSDDWLIVVLSGVRHRIDELIAPGAAAARRYPHIAQAVRAFGDSRYSVSASARLLNVHPNSVKYRLDRWKSLTGWDVHTFSGLASSLVSLELGEI
ncbi:helix-turn-helix domain-containing protein [Streptomyces sp. NBC_00075]|uniref:PucR family transcriptional regulator n=1 Tax=Streptomyces sp. NBC_00075 TaxID=2975641 RepID=UPI0032468E72